MSAQEVDWSKAPEWATVFIKGTYSSSFYFEKTDRYERDGGLFRLKADAASFTVYQRPWGGEGLPPVEAKCRIIAADTPWWKYSGLTDGETVTVHHSFKNSKGCDMVVVEACNGACLTVIVKCLAPIRTPEQIAAELADQAIKEIAGIICRDGAFDIDDPEVTESAVALYDAGYRKSPERAK